MKKSNKILIIIGVILLNVLVLYMIGQNLMGKTSEYDEFLAEARNYAKEELCSKSIEKYEDALAIKDTLDVCLEMIPVYEKGINNGEFGNVYNIVSTLRYIIRDYRNDAAAYEEACDFFLRYEKYEECADALIQARDLNITSEKIEKLRSDVRYQYQKNYSMYDTVLPCYDGYYTVSKNGAFLHLDDEASPYSGASYTYLSSFSEGYAFAKSDYYDGTEKSFIINENEQRQVYLENVESSSGAGVGKDENGNQILLLSCKIEDKYTYYNINGEKAFGEYVFAGRFRNNVAAVMKSEGEWKLIDGTGEAITDETFTDVVLNEFDECAPKGIIIANNGEGYHLYNHKGEQIGDFVCDGAKAFVDSYAAFKKGERWGFVDVEGNVVIDASYDDAKSFSNQMGAVKNGETWFFINSDNEITVEETFEDVDYLNSKGICFVKINGYWCNLKFYYTGK